MSPPMKSDHIFIRLYIESASYLLRVLFDFRIKPVRHWTKFGIVSRVAVSEGGVLFFAWFRRKKAGEVARTVHDAQDFNTLGQRLIKDKVVVEAAYAPAPHAGQPGVVKILRPSHTRHRGSRC